MCGALPRYHPPWLPGAPVCTGSPLIGVAMPGLLASAAGPAAFFRRLRGDLRVALAPGLPPSPGRSWPRTPLLVPIHASRSAQCTAPRGQRPTGFPGAGRRRRRPRTDPNGEVRRPDPGTPGPADYPAGSWAQRMQACRAAPGGAGESVGVPRCRGPEVDLSSQHDSRARSQYVKGPRPWWRRRPPCSRHGAARRRRSQAAESRPAKKNGAKKSAAAKAARKAAATAAKARRRRRRRRPRRPPAKKAAAKTAAKKAARRRRRQEEQGGGETHEEHRHEERGKTRPRRRARPRPRRRREPRQWLRRRLLARPRRRRSPPRYPRRGSPRWSRASSPYAPARTLDPGGGRGGARRAAVRGAAAERRDRLVRGGRSPA